MRMFTSGLVFCAALLCASGQSLAQVTPPPPKEQLSADEQAMLDKLRKSGEAVFSIGSRVCVRELGRISAERSDSKQRSPKPETRSMQAIYETDMFFARSRLTAIDQHCGKPENMGDYAMTERYLEKTSEACRAAHTQCEARRHF